MDVLIALGTSASYLYAVISIIVALNAEKGNMNMGYHFFETSAVLISFVLLGKYLQALATRKTSKALSKLMKLTPKTATLVTFDPLSKQYTNETSVDIDLVQRNDVLKIIRGSSVPADGVLVSGSISVDEAMITGESLPVLKVIDSECIGGTVNVEGTGYLKVTFVGGDSTLNQIVKVSFILFSLGHSLAPLNQITLGTADGARPVLQASDSGLRRQDLQRLRSCGHFPLPLLLSDLVASHFCWFGAGGLVRRER